MSVMYAEELRKKGTDLFSGEKVGKKGTDLFSEICPCESKVSGTVCLAADATRGRLLCVADFLARGRFERKNKAIRVRLGFSYRTCYLPCVNENRGRSGLVMTCHDKQ